MQLLLAGQVDAVMGYDFQVLDAVEKGLPAVTVADDPSSTTCRA